MKPPRVKERSLARLGPRGTKYFGLYHYDKRLVEIEPKQNEEERLDTLVHELLHHIDSQYKLGLTEEQVAEAATMVSRVQWSAGYRRVKL